MGARFLAFLKDAQLSISIPVRVAVEIAQQPARLLLDMLAAVDTRTRMIQIDITYWERNFRMFKAPPRLVKEEKGELSPAQPSLGSTLQ